MSVATDTASKVHEKHINAVTRSQDLVVSAVEKVAHVVDGLLAKSPTVPDAVAGPLQKVVAPVTKVVGDRPEVTSYLTNSVKDWADAQQEFQAALLGVVVSDDKSAPAAKAKPKAKAKA